MVRRINALADEIGASLVVLDPAVPLGLVGPSLRLPYDVVLHGAEVTVPGRLPGTRQALGTVLRGARHVVSAGEYAAREAERAAGRPLPVTVVPPGVDVERFRPLSARGAQRRPRPLRHPRRRRAGRVDLPARAAQGFRRRHPGRRRAGPIAPRLLLAIAGSGRDERRLRRLAADLGAPVRFLGRVAHDDLPLLYGCADMFTMACRTRWGGLEQEGFGIVFVEAAACGTPQIAGDSGGAAEAVVDGVTGRVLARPERWSDVAAAIDELLDDDDRRAAMSEASRERAVTEFSYDVLARRLGESLAVVRVSDRPTSWSGGSSSPTRSAPPLFVVTAVLAAVFFTTALQWVGAITALALFAVGVFCFLWSYVQAVQRSRTDEISVASLYFLTGPATPTAVKRQMLGLLAVQVVTAAATTFARLDGPDGEPGSSLAVGFLVPMFGFGLNGLWAALHGSVPAAPARRGADRRRGDRRLDRKCRRCERDQPE